MLAAVDAVEQEVQPAGRGGRAFPFNRIQLRFVAASPKAQVNLEVMCEGPPSLQTRIVERLQAEGCTVKALDVEVSFPANAEADWTHGDFDIQYARSAGTPASPVAPARLELTVAHGTAERTVKFSTARRSR